MGDVTAGGQTVDQRTKVLLIRHRELEVQHLEYQIGISRLKAQELEVEILRQGEQAEANKAKIDKLREEIAKMKGEQDG